MTIPDESVTWTSARPVDFDAIDFGPGLATAIYRWCRLLRLLESQWPRHILSPDADEDAARPA